MSRIAVTGHVNLTSDSTDLVAQAISGALVGKEGLVGISCLAQGADSIFAEQVLNAGGYLEAVIPSADYRERKVKPGQAQQFDALIARASRVDVLPFAEANRDAYEAANERMLASCDELLAVWDGQGSVDKGGTAEVVFLARTRGIPVTVIWPEGVAREP